MNEKKIIKALAQNGDNQRRYSLMVPNCYTSFDNEADLFAIRKSGFCDEFEVKVTRSDFLADAKKRVSCRVLSQQESIEWYHNPEGVRPDTKAKHDALQDGDLDANYFWYVVKEGICKPEEVPGFAGLIVVKDGCSLSVVQMPTRLHSRKLDMEKRFNYARKAGYRFWRLFLAEEEAA